MSAVIELSDNGVAPHQQDKLMMTQPENNIIKKESPQPDENIVHLEPPDGGWGWAVVAGGNLSLAFAAMTGPCFGILFSKPLLEMGASSTSVAWIFNVSQLFSQCSGIFGGPLVKAFGFRKTGIVVGFITALSMLLSAFAMSPEFLYFSFSILCGTSAGLTMTVPFLIVPLYFKKLLGRATTYMVLGINVGQILGPGLVSYLQDEFGFRGATMIMSALFLHCVVGAILFHPVEWHMKRVTHVHHPLLSTSLKGNSENNLSIHNEDTKRNANDSCYLGSSEDLKSKRLNSEGMNAERITSTKRSSDASTKDPASKLSTFLGVIRNSFIGIKILKSPCASIICFGGAFFFNGFFNLYVLLPFAIQSRGLPLQVAALCISASAVCSLCTRVVLSVIIDRPWFNKTFIYIFGNCVLVTSAIVLPWMTTQFGMVLVMLFWGMGLSLNFSLHNLLMIQYMGLENLPKVLGASKFANGLIFITVGPLIGFVRDVTNDYTIAISVLAGTMSVCIVLWLFMPMAVAYEERKAKTPSDTEI
ncbi:unnamed protein product [Meganyctiphanes norvegica]|uniref:Uncharacterized protein n=1 Tax=Meganyctiphanes norvegica TaxID=48144 RepID=A0AAV2QLT1_MEGNR